ncbi:hypothetical protein K2D_45500 [Planctomycetes bacterium K2D]|uniref:Uncharacterized protein n=1 Tax=Botrimarina mediterranea TaxID=2528022 RepID=A0A518KEU2_9BACT|nr:hypothetical protein Spa11_45470 [Botrimarina mediterranea]QDV80915.1 hypothetical protein K2D_45500 [Planctomycetes bacterium K2D]
MEGFLGVEGVGRRPRRSGFDAKNGLHRGLRYAMTLATRR